MQLIDTHCHIQETQWDLGDNETHRLWERFGNPDPNSLIARAQEHGVEQMICVGTTLANSRQAVEFVRDRPQCWASIGIHPHDSKDGEPALHHLRALLAAETAHAHSKIVAIGECGLDYFYGHSPKQDQIKALRFQIELALEYNLPLIFHVRDAFADFLPIFDSYQNLRGVVHSFTDSRTVLNELLARDLYIGVNGIATFAKDHDQQAMYRLIPLGKLVLETDAPFLTPVPLRGRMNEPANVRLVAEFLADLRGESFETVATRTTHNAQTLFSLT